MKYGSGVTRKGNLMYLEADQKRQCWKCKLFNELKTKMECEPVGEIKNPAVPYCSFYNLKALLLKMDKEKMDNEKQ